MVDKGVVFIQMYQCMSFGLSMEHISICPKVIPRMKYMYKCVYCSTVDKRKKLGLFKRPLDQEICIHPSNTIQPCNSVS